MDRVNRRIAAASLALLGVLATAAAALPPSGHEQTPPAGSHPRLLFSAADLPALRAQVAASGSLSGALFGLAAGRTPRKGTVPSLFDALDANAPLLACLAAIDADRQMWARYAIDASIAAVRQHEPPYPDSPEWQGRALYRYIALTYDCCYDRMTASERAELQDEMVRILSLIGPGGEGSSGNHQVVFAVGAGLSAMALDGDLSNDPRTILNEAVVRGGVMPDGDFLRYRSGNAITSIGLSPGESRYVAGRDYAIQWMRHSTNMHNFGYGIKWLPTAVGPPATGQTYYVTYVFTPEIPLWKDRARSTVQRNLDHLWADGASMAGVMYGSWTLWWATDLLEACRRNMGFDFSTHPNVRDAVTWFPYELIPGPGLRVNNRNDSTYAELDNRARAIPYLAWAMTRYAGDPAGRDAIAKWLLRRSSVWTSYTSCREALWATGPWPIPVQPTPSLPRSRFFRGHNLAAFRDADWDAPTNDWSLLSLVSGPWTGMEHDQTDKGSFTFYACGEDFAIDSGYAQGSAGSDSTAAHNYLLIDGAGQPGPWGTSGEVRSHLLSARCDALHADLKKSYVNTFNWSVGTPSPWPMRQADRYALFLKHAGRAPYAVIADSIDKDGLSHSYEWLLHTQAGNTVAINGTTATVTGKNNQGVMKAYLSGAVAPALRQDTWTPGSGAGVSAHPRLIAQVSAVNPQLLAVLVPERKTEGNPIAVTTATGTGFASATATWGTLTDRIVQNRTAGLSLVTVGDIETDAALAVVRTDGAGAVQAWTVLNGTTLRCQGSLLWSASAPSGTRGSASYDGAALSAIADDATAFSAHAPGLASFLYRDWTFAGTPSGNLLQWSGTARMADTLPSGTAAVSVDFSSTTAPWWYPHPLGASQYTRVTNGELCSPGIRKERISFTNRVAYDQVGYVETAVFANVLQRPRTHFGDATLEGKVTLVDFVSGNVLKIAGRVSDRTFPYSWVGEGADQDLVRAEVNPAGTVSLVKRMGGAYATLATASVAPLAKGSSHLYKLVLSGSRATFWLDGVSLLDFTDAGAFPSQGYFQWEVPYGMHIHLDDVKVTLPGVAQAPPPASAPVVLGVSPSAGPPAGWTSVTIGGDHFQAGATVRFGGVAATGVSVVNANTITCLTPAHTAGSVDVSVTNPDGQSGTRTGGYAYDPSIPSPPPAGVGVSPANGSTAGGTSVTVAGDRFLPGATVRFGGVAATGVSVFAPDTIVCATPAHAAGSVDVTVTNLDGRSGTLPGGFLYVQPPPQVTAASPSSGSVNGGTSVTLSGAAFQAGATVTFGGAAATSVVVASSTTITCVTPAHAQGTVNVVATNPDGQTGTLSGGFQFKKGGRR